MNNQTDNSNPKISRERPSLKVIPLGGNGEVTKNMYVYEYQDSQILVDCGIGFPTSDMLGVDVLIPDISYLERNPKKILGVVLTHGHEDHIGGLPYILPRLPKDLPVYGSTLTVALAENKVREYGLTNPFIPSEDKLDLGPFHVDLIHVTHSIPNCKHLVIKTPAGTVYHGADYKFDLRPPDGRPPAFTDITRASVHGIDLLLSDCLRVEKDGFTKPEIAIQETFADLMRKTSGKFIVTTIGSSISRMGMAVEVAASQGRKIAFVGRSVIQNMEIATKLGYVKAPKNTIIRQEHLKKYPDSQVALIVAGSQGQEGSAMQRAAAGEHKFVQLNPGDRVVISSDTIPGNESAVYSLIDTLTKKGIEVSYSSVTEGLHVSGHGYRGELELMVRLTNPKAFFPIGGNIRHQHGYRKMVEALGYPSKNVFLPEEGQMLVLTDHHVKYGPKVDLKNIYVDGLGIGDVGKVVLRDRQVMAEDGILIVIVPIRHDSGKISGDIEVVSRGFVYMKESQELISEIKDQVTKTLVKNDGVVTDWGFLRKKIEGSLEKFLFAKTERNPLILPVVVEV